MDNTTNMWNIMNNSLSARAKHFSSLERRTLMRLVRMHSDVLEDKRLSKDINAYKIRCWDRIAEIYNATPGFAYRDKLQLKKCWENIKFRIKKGDIAFEQSFQTEMEVMDSQVVHADYNSQHSSAALLSEDTIVIKDEESNPDDNLSHSNNSFINSGSNLQSVNFNKDHLGDMGIFPSGSFPNVVINSKTSQSNSESPVQEFSSDQNRIVTLNNIDQSSRVPPDTSRTSQYSALIQEKKKATHLHGCRIGLKLRNKRNMNDLLRREQILKIQLLNEEIKQSTEQHAMKMRILQNQCDLLEMQKSRYANGFVSSSIEPILKL